MPVKLKVINGERGCLEHPIERKLTNDQCKEIMELLVRITGDALFPTSPLYSHIEVTYQAYGGDND